MWKMFRDFATSVHLPQIRNKEARSHPKVLVHQFKKPVEAFFGRFLNAEPSIEYFNFSTASWLHLPAQAVSLAASPELLVSPT